MAVDPQTSPHRHVHAGETHYFCSAACRSKFAADPAKYLADKDLADKDLTGGAANEPPQAAAGTIYTCPMHPQIRQRARFLPDLRHGAGAGGGRPRTEQPNSPR